MQLCIDWDREIPPATWSLAIPARSTPVPRVRKSARRQWNLGCSYLNIFEWSNLHKYQNVPSILWTKGSYHRYIRFWMLLIQIHGLFGSDSCLYPHHLKVSNDFWVAGVHRVHQALSPELLRWPAWRSGLLQLRVIHQVHQKTIKKTLLVGGLEHEFYDFPYIGNVIIPTDFHIFQRGRYTTNQPMKTWWKSAEDRCRWAFCTIALANRIWQSPVQTADLSRYRQRGLRFAIWIRKSNKPQRHKMWHPSLESQEDQFLFIWGSHPKWSIWFLYFFTKASVS